MPTLLSDDEFYNKWNALSDACTAYVQELRDEGKTVDGTIATDIIMEVFGDMHLESTAEAMIVEAKKFILAEAVA